MSVMELGVQPRQALEMVLYIAAKLKEVPKRKQPEPDVHEVLKIRYFADKIHLSRYGFPASGDRYVAMKFGPVASLTYDLLKVARGDASDWAKRNFGKLIDGVLKVEQGGDHYVYPQRDADLGWLAPSDIEALNEAIAAYGNMDFDSRYKFSHDAAWEAAWSKAQAEGRKQSDMPLKSIASTLDNAEQVIAALDA